MNFDGVFGVCGISWLHKMRLKKMIFVVRVTLWSLELKSLVFGILNIIYNAHDSLKGLQSVAAVHRTPSSKYRIF